MNMPENFQHKILLVLHTAVKTAMRTARERQTIPINVSRLLHEHIDKTVKYRVSSKRLTHFEHK